MGLRGKYIQFTKAYAVIRDEVQESENILQYAGQMSQEHRKKVNRFRQLGQLCLDFGRVVECAKKSKHFAGHPHLLIYLSPSSLFLVVNSVQTEILEQS